MIRQRVEVLFGLPTMKMPWSLYLAQLNEAGKLTARSFMDMMIVVLETIEELESKAPETLGEMLESVKPVETTSSSETIVKESKKTK